MRQYMHQHSDTVARILCRVAQTHQAIHDLDLGQRGALLQLSADRPTVLKRLMTEIIDDARDNRYQLLSSDVKANLLRLSQGRDTHR